MSSLDQDGRGRMVIEIVPQTVVVSHISVSFTAAAIA